MASLGFSGSASQYYGALHGFKVGFTTEHEIVQSITLILPA